MIGVHGTPPRPAVRDLLLAAAGAVAVVAGTVLAAMGQAEPRVLDVFGVLLLVAAVVATVGWRRVAPMWSLVGATLVVNAYLITGYPFGPVLLCLVVAVFEVARQRRLAVSGIACGLAAAVASATMLVRLLGDPHVSGLLALAWTGWIVLPWSLGALVHLLGEARRRARRDLISRTVLAERMRLASELHDIAGHGFALASMQAGVALLVLDEQPEQARRSIEAIRETSDTALASLRRMLDTVHPGPSMPADAAGVDGLADLLDRVRAGGLPVKLETDGPGAVPEPLGPVVYRLIQEALTNVLRHAGPTTARVTIGRLGRDMVVRVVDRGAATADTVRPPGRGLAGMCRRVEDLDGRFEAGPRAGGGFQVVARLPVPEGAR